MVALNNFMEEDRERLGMDENVWSSHRRTHPRLLTARA